MIHGKVRVIRRKQFFGMAEARAASYQTQVDADSLEDLSKRLQADVRSHIRSLVR